MPSILYMYAIVSNIVDDFWNNQQFSRCKLFFLLTLYMHKPNVTRNLMPLCEISNYSLVMKHTFIIYILDMGNLGNAIISWKESSVGKAAKTRTTASFTLSTIGLGLFILYRIKNRSGNECLKRKLSSGHVIALWKKRCEIDQKRLIMLCISIGVYCKVLESSKW